MDRKMGIGLGIGRTFGMDQIISLEESIQETGGAKEGGWRDGVIKFV